LAEVRLQLDEHMWHAVARALRQQGIDVLTSAEAGLLDAPDTEQLAYAAANGRVIATQDRDFLRLHASGYAHAGIAYARSRSRAIGQIIAALTLIHEIYTAEEMVGRIEYL